MGGVQCWQFLTQKSCVGGILVLAPARKNSQIHPHFDMSLTCCRHVADMSPTCRRHVADMSTIFPAKSLCKPELIIRPDGDLNRDDWIKPWHYHLENTPEIVIPIFGFIVDRGKSSIDLWREGTRDELWEEVHQCFPHSHVAMDTKTRNAEAFKPDAQHDSIKWHECKYVV